MNRQLKQAVLSLRKAKRSGNALTIRFCIDEALGFLTPPRKRPPKELPKPLQNTKPARKAAYKQSAREIRTIVFERSEGHCELGVACLAREVPDSLEWHHLEQGSGRRRQQEAVSNTMAVCRACHRAYHHDPETFRFAVEEWAHAFGYPTPSRFRNAPLSRRGTA